MKTGTTDDLRPRNVSKLLGVEVQLDRRMPKQRPERVMHDAEVDIVHLLQPRTLFQRSPYSRSRYHNSPALSASSSVAAGSAERGSRSMREASSIP